MEGLPDSLDIRSMSIPGTHDSCTFNASSSLSKCQSVNLEEQLEMGIRFFDLRPILVSGVLKMFHGIDDLGITLNQVFGKFKTFLTSYPNEVILYRFMREDLSAQGVSNGDDDYIDLLTEALSDIGQSLLDTSTIVDFKLEDNGDLHIMGDVPFNVEIIDNGDLISPIIE